MSRDLDKAHKVGQGSKVQLPNDGKSKAKALAEAGISCNVIAGFRHDHLFVDWDRGPDAEALLRRL